MRYSKIIVVTLIAKFIVRLRYKFTNVYTYVHIEKGGEQYLRYESDRRRCTFNNCVQIVGLKICHRHIYRQGV